jgi:hypothetical protein
MNSGIRGISSFVSSTWGLGGAAMKWLGAVREVLTAVVPSATLEGKQIEKHVMHQDASFHCIFSVPMLGHLPLEGII